MTPRVTMSMPQALRGECRVDGRLVHLSEQLADLLAALLVAGPRGLTWEEMIEAVWPDPDEQALEAEGIISVRVMQLRRLGVPIENHPMWGRGYLIPIEARPPGRMVHGCQQADACQWRPRPDRTKQPYHLCLRCRNTLKNEARMNRLTPIQVRVWRFMERHPGATVDQTAERLDLQRKTVEGTRLRLLRKGLVERIVKPGNVRGTYHARQGHPRYMAQLREMEAGKVDRAHMPAKVARIDPRMRPLLEAIANDPGATTQELAAQLGLASCTIYTSAHRLVARGAAEKVPSLIDMPRRGQQRPNRYVPTEAGMLSLNQARAEAGMPPLANSTGGRSIRVHEEIVARARAAADRRAARHGAGANPRPDRQGPARQGPPRSRRDQERHGEGAHRAEQRQQG